MNYDTQAFRERYRAAIKPSYNAWLHGGFLLVYAPSWVVFFGSTLTQVQALEWLTIPLTLVFFNWGEYTVHKAFGHHKKRLGTLFYKRHTGDHHSFFVDGQMRYESPRDWRVILFPAWLVVIYSLGLALPAWWLLAPINSNIAALFSASLMMGYLSYEFFHSCEHLPDSHPLAQLPWIKQMRRHHQLHHRRDLMQTHNFNIVFPLMDWLYGTYFRESDAKSTTQKSTNA